MQNIYVKDGAYMNKSKKTPKVSVIVPMYNCAILLPAFFQDMENQTLRNFELICVIDGATDNTLEVVKQHSSKSDKIRYFYKEENEGAGFARNYGLTYARGEYVMWIDADDRYSPNLLAEMVYTADKFSADEVLCLCKSHDYLLNTIKENIGFFADAFPENTCVNPAKISNLFQKMGSGPTNKLYRLSFVKENHLSYSNTMVANDVKFIYSAISVAKRVVGIHKHLITFERNINPDSITSNREKYSEQIFIATSELYVWLKERNLFERYRNTFLLMFKTAFLYNAEFGVNSKYIEAAVKTLNVEEPWINISSEEIGKLFGQSFDTKKIKEDITKLEEECSANKDEKAPNPLVRIKKLKSRLEIIALCKTFSIIRYNRDFDEYKTIQLENQLESTKQQLNNMKQQLSREKSSWNYKIGSMITWLPKKIYYSFKWCFKQ